MKNKIQREFILVALSSILLTTVLVTAVFSGFFRNEILDELRTCARVIQSAGIFDGQEEVYTDVGADELRITLIDTDGTVIYDNDVAVGDLDNHGNRPEVELASEQGEGLAVRRSNTLDRDAFYYAVQQEDGTVLRVAKEASSVWDIFRSALPISLALALLILILCILLSARATKSLMAPITQLAEHLDEEETMPVYKEMIPFVNTIRKQHDDIMRNAKMRQDFTANVSHELKTPIALIQGYAEGLKEGINDDAESREFYCDVIMDESAKMNNMVKKLLTLNQLEFGNDVVTMERFDIVALIRNYIQSADILVKQNEATVNFDETDPVYVWGDEFKTEEVVMNYFSNALNHLDGDRVVDIKLKKQDKTVRISVFNTGIPIPEDSLPHLWEKFYKVDKARTREYGGSGVGLSIVKAIQDSIHQKYGVINYENGVEFWFEMELVEEGTGNQAS